MQISRRDALVGAGAAAVVASVPGAVQGATDPQIEALMGQLRAARARLENINILYRASGAEELGEESDNTRAARAPRAAPVRAWRVSRAGSRPSVVGDSRLRPHAGVLPNVSD